MRAGGHTRTNGSVIVGVAVLGITSVLAVSQVYLPFYMDRDWLTGSQNVSKEEQRREMAIAMAHQRQPQPSPELVEAQKSKAAGSMWANIRGKQN